MVRIADELEQSFQGELVVVLGPRASLLVRLNLMDNVNDIALDKVGEWLVAEQCQLEGFEEVFPSTPGADAVSNQVVVEALKRMLVLFGERRRPNSC